ncbi:E3 ubiquitin-protein ligase PPP1R11-like isoform X5 [Hylaeus anthracinus]|uniref:E3 ubiquitin-protein ligase PPP1R11-like isoform X5 n=1 Tax=Hylaeus anthracinus TaxID=313031 RepID=UPI0023B8BEA8|nr:E3 ubiquitin-protein ligase PPP1R11-like isoform X5 [Hylaeus anthracinus]
MDRSMMSEQSATQIQTETVLETDVTDSGSQDVPTVRLRLRKPKPNKKVQWTQGTVDNEHMNKKKSKCKLSFNITYLCNILGCCIYEKPRTFGESSSEDSDDECEHCHGHKDIHKKIMPHNAETSKEEGIPPSSESIVKAST